MMPEVNFIWLLIFHVRDWRSRGERKAEEKEERKQENIEQPMPNVEGAPG